MDTKEYGLRWMEIARNGNIITKEKWFTSEIKREHYSDKLFEKDNFYQFVAYSNPRY